MMNENNEQVELTVDRLGIYGEGVARLQGLTVFVDGALPGERVHASISEQKKTYARARLLALEQSSPFRVKPVCPVFGLCGGCQIMHLDYPKQLEAKRERVADALQRIGKIEGHVLPCISSPQPLEYRNKIQLPVGENGRLGLYARNSHDLVEIERCYIHCPLGEKVFGLLQRILTENRSEALDLKHVLIKTAFHTSQVLVVFVTRTSKLLTHLTQRLMEEAPEVCTVVQNFNPSESNTILGPTFTTLAGAGWIEESLCGLSFRVSAASFFQVNPAQAEALYRKVIELAELSGEERVLDAYCGVGTLSLVMAQKTKQMIGIESVPQAILDAKDNAHRNGISNVKWICGKAEEKIGGVGEIDIATINPPRKGCEPAFLEALIKRAPRRIIYISCDPATLARDVEILSRGGYQLAVVQPFDMFPQTMHVECVALLIRSNSF